MVGRFKPGGRDFLLFTLVQTGPGVHQASCTLQQGLSLLSVSRVAGAWRLLPHLALAWRMSRRILLLLLSACVSCYEETCACIKWVNVKLHAFLTLSLDGGCVRFYPVERSFFTYVLVESVRLTYHLGFVAKIWTLTPTRNWTPVVFVLFSQFTACTLQASVRLQQFSL